MSDRVSIVVTSIFEPNSSLKELAKGSMRNNWEFLIIGDTKSPKNFVLPGAIFFDVQTQKRFDFKLANLCPEGHYTRKNLGYLQAIKNGASIIIETDDDNFPLKEFWAQRNNEINALTLKGEGWFNVYSVFSQRTVWPRGLPLESILNQIEVSSQFSEKKFSPIQQGLANGNPDVDAIFRMTQVLPLDFGKHELPVRLGKGLWSPFNSQNTTWYRQAFPLLYLPSFCSFRMTDIWRSFVAQRIAWECDWEIVFHNASVFQERNEHNLLRDFEQEIPGYLLNNRIKELLENTELKKGINNIADNLRSCYEVLIKEKVINSIKELELLNAWLMDIEKYG